MNTFFDLLVYTKDCGVMLFYRYSIPNGILKKACKPIKSVYTLFYLRNKQYISNEKSIEK